MMSSQNAFHDGSLKVPELHLDIEPLAHNYATYLWELTLYRIQKSTYNHLEKPAVAAFKLHRDQGGLTKEQKLEYKAWRDELEVSEIAAYNALSVGIEVTHSFQAARIAADLPLVEPAYCIDPTEPNERLQVQKEFDVGRAVKHLIVSGDDYAENLRLWQDDSGRCYYNNSIVMATYPQLSPVAELQAIKRLGVKAIEEKPWIPQWLAELAGIRRNGRPLDEGQWVYHQGCVRYKRVEDEFADEWKKITNNPFARPLPYQPTRQKGGHLRFDRGNRPPGIDCVKWTKTYNLADSEVYKEFGRRKERSIAARKNGRTRDRALMRLVEEGLIEADFVDSDP